MEKIHNISELPFRQLLTTQQAEIMPTDPFTQMPPMPDLLPVADRAAPHKLFSLFTADIIARKAVFVR
jgi:hypothetical protein